MCEFTDYVRQMRNELYGMSVAEMFPHQSQVIPYEEVKAGHCMTSGVPLSQEEMHPPGRCSRSLSDEQYGYIVNNRRSNCSMCGGQLSAQKIQGQQYQPREIENHFCDACIPYWSILHSKVVGEDMSFLADEGQASGPAQIVYQPVRGIEHKPQQTFADLFEQRQQEYEKKPVVTVPLKKNKNGHYEMDRN